MFLPLLAILSTIFLLIIDRTNGDCPNEMPLATAFGVVEISYFANTLGGGECSNCPVACTTAINSVKKNKRQSIVLLAMAWT